MSTTAETYALVSKIRAQAKNAAIGVPGARVRAMLLALEKIEGGGITKREMVSLAHAALKPFVLPRTLP